VKRSAKVGNHSLILDHVSRHRVIQIDFYSCCFVFLGYYPQVPQKVGRQLKELPNGDPRKAYGMIRVQRAWRTKEKKYGPTKGHYWRNVPINSDLYWWLVKYLSKAKFGTEAHGERLFESLPYWRRGEQSKTLRLFCEANGIPSIMFHTLRACFATQLLGMGVPETKVMKIGGWKDAKTMMIYVRMAGIQEFGAAEGLRFRSNGYSEFDPNSPHTNLSMRSVNELDFSSFESDENDSEDNVIVLNSLRNRKRR